MYKLSFALFLRFVRDTTVFVLTAGINHDGRQIRHNKVSQQSFVPFGSSGSTPSSLAPISLHRSTLSFIISRRRIYCIYPGGRVDTGRDIMELIHLPTVRDFVEFLRDFVELERDFVESPRSYR